MGGSALSGSLSIRLCFHRFRSPQWTRNSRPMDPSLSISQSPAETTLSILGNLKLLSLPMITSPLLSVCVQKSVCVCVFSLSLCFSESTTLEYTLSSRRDGVGTLGLCSHSQEPQAFEATRFNI